MLPTGVGQSVGTVPHVHQRPIARIGPLRVEHDHRIGPRPPRVTRHARVDPARGPCVVEEQPQPQRGVPGDGQLADLRVREQGARVGLVLGPRRPPRAVEAAEEAPASPVLDRAERHAGERRVARPVPPAPPHEQGRPTDRQPGRAVGHDHTRDVDEPSAPPHVRHVVQVGQVGRVGADGAGQHRTAHHLAAGGAVMIGGAEHVHVPVGTEPVERHLEEAAGQRTPVRRRHARGDEPGPGGDERQPDARFRPTVRRPRDAVAAVRIRPGVAEEEPQASVVLERRPEVGTDDPEPGLGAVEGEGVLLPVPLTGELAHLLQAAGNQVDPRPTRRFRVKVEHPSQVTGDAPGQTAGATTGATAGERVQPEWRPDRSSPTTTPSPREASMEIDPHSGAA